MIVNTLEEKANAIRKTIQCESTFTFLEFEKLYAVDTKDVFDLFNIVLTKAYQYILSNHDFDDELNCISEDEINTMLKFIAPDLYYDISVYN